MKGGEASIGVEVSAPGLARGVRASSQSRTGVGAPKGADGVLGLASDISGTDGLGSTDVGARGQRFRHEGSFEPEWRRRTGLPGARRHFGLGLNSHNRDAHVDALLTLGEGEQWAFDEREDANSRVGRCLRDVLVLRSRVDVRSVMCRGLVREGRGLTRTGLPGIGRLGTSRSGVLCGAGSEGDVLAAADTLKLPDNSAEPTLSSASCASSPHLSAKMPPKSVASWGSPTG